MSAAARSTPSVLSPEDLEHFARHGFVRLEQAFPRELALCMQDEIWRELAQDHGIERDDRGTWKTPAYSARRAKHLPLNEQLASARFTGAISDLLGRDDWPRPATWGGFLVNLPTNQDAPEWDVPSDTWHWDGPPDGGGLLIFSFYGSVAPRAGGTLVVGGSQRVIAAFYASLTPEERARPHKAHRKLLPGFDPWLATLMSPSNRETQGRIAAFMERDSSVRDVPCRVVELTGEPGDAVFCNPGILHAAAVNSAGTPRFLRVKFLMMK